MGLTDLLRRWGRSDEQRAEHGEEGGLGLPDEPITGDYVADPQSEAVLPEPDDGPVPP
jgi:hypothetical protein